MKKLLTILTVLVLVLGGISTAHAEILPPHGEGQIGLQAVVLCESLTVRKAPDTSSKVVETLDYGDLPIVTEQEDGWARCVLGDSEDSPWGWVNADYLPIAPGSFCRCSDPKDLPHHPMVVRYNRWLSRV